MRNQGYQVGAGLWISLLTVATVISPECGLWGFGVVIGGLLAGSAVLKRLGSL